MDIVQEAHLGAFRFFGGCQAGRDACAWLVEILRNASIPENNRPARLSAEETLRQRFRLKTIKKSRALTEFQSVQGYNTLAWRRDGLYLWSVSEWNADKLFQIVQLLPA